MNIKQALRHSILQGVCRLDAEALLCHILNKNKVYLITHDEDVLDENTFISYQDMCSQVIAGYPLAYILEYKEFYSLNFKVTPDVLIPRADTECLVDFAIHHAPKNGYVLDLGTGSGIIAVTLAYYRPDLIIYACDISLKALEIAAYNAKQHSCERIIYINSDWFSNMPPQTLAIKWDMIISNPPYIHKNDSHLQESIRFEPRLALTDEEDGLQDIKHIIEQAVHYLKPNAILAIEHGYTQYNDVIALFSRFKYTGIENIKDLAQHIRVTYAKNKS